MVGVLLTLPEPVPVALGFHYEGVSALRGFGIS